MPTRNISLTPEQDAFVAEAVRSGAYQNASEAVRDALRGLQERLKEERLKHEILSAHLKAGLDALARGECTEIEDADLDSALDALARDRR